MNIVKIRKSGFGVFFPGQNVTMDTQLFSHLREKTGGWWLRAVGFEKYASLSSRGQRKRN